MNARKSRTQRRAVRQIGKDPREVVLTRGSYTIPSMHPLGIGCTFTPREMRPDCGRAIYRTLKKAERRGLVPGV